MNRVRFKVKGKNIQRLLKRLILRKIQLYDIIYTKDEAKFTVFEKDVSEVLKFKDNYEIVIINNFGFLKIKYLIIKYRFIILFLMIAITVILTLSHFVFDIEVIHQKEEVRELILQDLKEFGISKYRPKVSYLKKEEIRNKILEKEKDKIEWLEIDNIGTKYIVNVEERLLDDTNDDDSPRDIVAKKDAMILSIEAEKGEITKKKYDYVRSGETLISGTIMNKDREVSKVKATGVVYGEVWYKVEVILPKVYHEEIRTGDVSKNLAVRLINKKITLPLDDKNKSYEIEDKVLWENRLFPLKLVIEKKYELKITDKRYDINNCEEAAFEVANRTLQRKLKDNSTILSKKVLKKTMNNSTIIVDVFFKVQEDITDYKKISSELKEGDQDERVN